MSGQLLEMSGGLLDLLQPSRREPASVEVPVATKTILQLCADTGSDTWPYRSDSRYEVITIGADIGVENYTPDRPIHGIIANPVCDLFSKVGGRPRAWSDPDAALWMVRECQRIIREAQPAWYAIENPSSGAMRHFLGTPRLTYQPWHYGSPWTKATALWGEFAPPARIFHTWDAVPKNPHLYIRPPHPTRVGADKPSLSFQHRSVFELIPEFAESGMPMPSTDAELRSLCSQRFARAFKEANP